MSVERPLLGEDQFVVARQAQSIRLPGVVDKELATASEQIAAVDSQRIALPSSAFI
jgi:hypothetical protein